MELLTTARLVHQAFPTHVGAAHQAPRV